MKKTINYYDFKDEFKNYGRQEQFSEAGLKALFEHLERLGEDCEQEIELDVIGLCTYLVEYDSLDEFHNDYDKDEYPTIEVLRDHTQVIEINDNSFIIEVF